MSSDYCSETSFYANAKSIVESIKLFIAEYFYGEFSELNVISRSLFVVVRFITTNIKLSIKENFTSDSAALREERGENHFPFFAEVGGTSMRCSAEHSRRMFSESAYASLQKCGRDGRD